MTNSLLEAKPSTNRRCLHAGDLVDVYFQIRIEKEVQQYVALRDELKGKVEDRYLDLVAFLLHTHLAKTS